MREASGFLDGSVGMMRDASGSLDVSAGITPPVSWKRNAAVYEGGPDDEHMASLILGESPVLFVKASSKSRTGLLTGRSRTATPGGEVITAWQHLVLECEAQLLHGIRRSETNIIRSSRHWNVPKKLLQAVQTSITAGRLNWTRMPDVQARPPRHRPCWCTSISPER